MIANAAIRKAINKVAYALSQRAFAKIRADLEDEVERAMANGASEQELYGLLRYHTGSRNCTDYN